MHIDAAWPACATGAASVAQLLSSLLLQCFCTRAEPRCRCLRPVDECHRRCCCRRCSLLSLPPLLARCLQSFDADASAQLKKAITASYGSYEGFVAAFTSKAGSLFGSGWTWLSVAPGTKKLIITTTPNQVGIAPTTPTPASALTHAGKRGSDSTALMRSKVPPNPGCRTTH